MANLSLNVQFDINQDSQQLNWYFSDTHGKLSPRQGGTKSGVLSFNPGDALTALIVADSAAGQLESARIIDCALITTPLVNTWNMEKPGHYPEPSPFYKEGVGPGTIASFMPVKSNGGSARRQSFTGTTLIFANPGRWKLTFVMTVEITETSGVVTHRVFGFDPECEVGTGVDGGD